MHEKDFFIRKITKVARIFLKDLKTSAKLLGAGRNRSREWITVAAIIYVDGIDLPPLLIYNSTFGSLQD